ncbi:tRNA pseudouridine(55) synthase TruB [Anaerospora sp.]|jgi:tRNA pseudouridine55 synthase|uniref:tRNA pseudouridine(55) synthase TruB n=1 Tax=Anaerospora sp. TaxID=1960278 RepID=UPI00289AF716|nr:tRNA pseudouridine(55) synthase TruB [Anaerospora sp.]MDF2928215.1 tRNA pseudouridine synthase [Anaerospora sp.]
MNGIINILKPPGMTSHDAVSYIRRVFAMKKVGHAGTLDPAAAGVLPVFLGSATRLIEYSTEAAKSYRVEVTFGFETDTGDDTGKVTQTGPCELPARQRLEEVLATFIGAITQIPPVYSAIKVDGKKLYELARAGIAVEPKARQVHIHDIRILEVRRSTLLLDVDCSKGTYIRSLCQDIGRKLGCPAVMSFLVRTKVGDFTLEQAVSIEEISNKKEAIVLPLDFAVAHLPLVKLSPSECKDLQQGKAVFTQTCPSSLVRLYDTQERLVGIGQYDSTSSLLKPVKILSLF